MSLAELTQYYQEVSRCSRCGFCQPTCPTYKLHDGETDVARGRNTLVRAVIEGRAELNESSVGMIDECLRCGACVTACFAGVRTDRIMAAARAHYVETKGRGRLVQWLMEKVLPRRTLLTRLMRLAAWSKRLGLSRLSGLMRPFGAWGRGLARAEGMVKAVPTTFFSDQMVPGTRLAPYGEKKATVGYFVGCRTEFLYPGTGKDTVEVLRRCGAEVVLLAEPASCCGLPPYSYGYAAATRELVKRNVLAFDALPCDAVVTEIGSCYHFLREYGVLYGEDPEFGPAARRVSGKVKYLADFVEQAGLGQASYPHKVTFQDSCQLVHLQKTSQAPRDLLKSLEGVDYREMSEAAWCCGGAGAYTFTHPDQAEPMLQRKLANLRATGAEELVVACQSCYLQISHGVREAGMPVKVRHLAEVLEDATRPRA
jgi:glycolate oxidase iron-sulfur subunit